jgi:hypothetical protein
MRGLLPFHPFSMLPDERPRAQFSVFAMLCPPSAGLGTSRENIARCQVRVCTVNDILASRHPVAGLGDPSIPGPSFRVLLVVPTLGRRLETLARTLASVAEQAGASVDVVVVAKTETRELAAVAADHGARLISHSGNISAAVNAGFGQADGTHKYACWLGDDDMLYPGALADATASLEREPSAVVAYGACNYIDLDGNLLFTRRPPPHAPHLLQFVPGLIKQEACLFRLSGLRTVGWLNETLKYTMDLDLLLRLRRVGSFVRVDRITAAFCWHPDSITVANRKVSLAEAQEVQRNHARGVARMLQPIWKPAVRALILLMTWKINRGME